MELTKKQKLVSKQLAESDLIKIYTFHSKFRLFDPYLRQSLAMVIVYPLLKVAQVERRKLQ